jgi:hypothetical protein
MAKNSSIYGPDLSVHEKQGKDIADDGLACMKGVGATDKEASRAGTAGGAGKDASHSELESFPVLLPKRPASD